MDAAVSAPARRVAVQLRHAGKVGRDAARRRMAAHGRPGDDGRAGLLPDRRPAQGYDHPRRRESLPRRDRRGLLPPSGRRRGGGRRPARRALGRGGRGVHPTARSGRAPTVAELRRHMRAHMSPQKTPTSGTPWTATRSPDPARSRSSPSARRGNGASTPATKSVGCHCVAR